MAMARRRTPTSPTVRRPASWAASATPHPLKTREGAADSRQEWYRSRCDFDRNSPPQASGLQPQSLGGLFLALALASPLLLWYTRSNDRFILGHSPEDRGHRLSRCRQCGSAGAPPSHKAVPVGVVPAPPMHLPRRSREPAGLEPTRSVSMHPSCTMQQRTEGDTGKRAQRDDCEEFEC
jgi:hypothetical protein